MIRINLLPEAKRAAVSSGSSQIWAIVYLLSLFAWCIVLFLFYLNYQSSLEEQRVANNELQRQIDVVRAKSANIGEIEAGLAKSRQLEEVVTNLQKARQGPSRVLMEVSSILSPGRGPSVSVERLEALRRDNPQAAFNPGWDSRRLWLTGFKEQSRRCTITGVGKTNEDVAEFLRRLSLSPLFEGVTLQSTSASVQESQPVVTFNLSCRVKY